MDLREGLQDQESEVGYPRGKITNHLEELLRYKSVVSSVIEQASTGQTQHSNPFFPCLKMLGTNYVMEGYLKFPMTIIHKQLLDSNMEIAQYM